MQITLSFDSFTELPYTSGTIQNISSQATVEICQDDTANTGLILGPGEWFSWSNSTVYARSAWDYEPTARCAVVPFKKGGEGGGSEYILPVASKSTLGGVKSSDEAGAIKVDSSGKMTYNAPSSTPLSAPDWETNTTYPENALVEYNGNIYICLTAHTSGTFADDLANGKWKLVSMTLTAATSSALDGVKSNSADGGVTVASDGKMTINLPKATSSELGGVKIGDGLSVTADGTLSATSAGGGISIWQANTEYNVNDVVIDSNLIWQCATAHTSSTTFDESKWVCISGGEISNGYEIVGLWSGTFSFNNSTDGAAPSSSTPMIELSDSIQNYEYLYVVSGVPSSDEEMSSSIVTVSEITVGTNCFRIGPVGAGNIYTTASICFYDNTHIYIKYKDTNTWSVGQVKLVRGIRKAKPIVSSGMKYETLWEGEAGSLSGSGSTTINLSEPVSKYQKIGLSLSSHSNSNKYRRYYVEVDVNEYIDLIINGTSGDSISYAWPQNDDYYFEITYGGTNQQLAIDYNHNIITKVIGISEGVQIPTGVQAARVILWEGKNNSYITSTNYADYANVQQQLNDSIRNYDYLEVYLECDNNIVGTFNDTSRAICTLSVKDLAPNTNTYRINAGIMGSSNGISYIIVFPDDTHYALGRANIASWARNPGVIKIVGIKYIQPDSYSTEEKLIGTWIDGKPLYRKVFTGTTPTNANNLVNIFSNLPLSSFGVFYVKGGFILKDIGNDMYNSYPINEDGDSDYKSRIFISGDFLSIRGMVGSGLTNCQLTVVIEYTKN